MPPSRGLLAACDDRRLIGLNLWPTQRKLLRDVEGATRLAHIERLGDLRHRPLPVQVLRQPRPFAARRALPDLVSLPGLA